MSRRYQPLVRSISCLVLAAAFLTSGVASAGRRRRPVFDPEDLDLQPKGQLTVGVDLGPVVDGSGTRILLPDLEIEYGIGERTELSLDVVGWLSNDGYHPDVAWLPLRHALLDGRLKSDDAAWAVGLQHGPRILPTASGIYFGYGAVAVAGLKDKDDSLAVQAGAFLDPVVDASRSSNASGGLDASHDFDDDWSVSGSLAVSHAPGAGWDTYVGAGIDRALSERAHAAFKLLGGYFADGWSIGAQFGGAMTFGGGAGKEPQP